MHILVLTGDLDACRMRLQWYRKGFHKKYGEDASVEVVDIDETTFDVFQNTLWGQSLFVEKRMVIVRGLPLATTNKKKEAQKFEEYLVQHWDTLDQGTVYILVSPDVDKRRALMKRCIKEKLVEVCIPREGAALKDLLLQLLPGVSPTVMKQILEITGEKEQEIRLLAQKLSLYAGNEAVTSEMVMLATKHVDRPDIFGLMDGLAARNLSKSTKALAALIESGEDIFMILSMCVRQFRIMYALSQAKSVEVMIKSLKLHPFVAKKTLQHVRLFPKKLLISGYHELHKLDRGIKTGEIRTSTDDQREIQIELERFIVGICVGL